MIVVNIHEAKTHFSKLIKQALSGQEIIVAKNGLPLIKLTPYKSTTAPRKGGQLRGLIIIEDNFDEPLPDDFLKRF